MFLQRVFERASNLASGKKGWRDGSFRTDPCFKYTAWNEVGLVITGQ
jgi:hypothetical protein